MAEARVTDGLVYSVVNSDCDTPPPTIDALCPMVCRRNRIVTGESWMEFYDRDLVYESLSGPPFTKMYIFTESFVWNVLSPVLTTKQTHS